MTKAARAPGASKHSQPPCLYTEKGYSPGHLLYEATASHGPTAGDMRVPHRPVSGLRHKDKSRVISEWHLASTESHKHSSPPKTRQRRTMPKGPRFHALHLRLLPPNPASCGSVQLANQSRLMSIIHVIPQSDFAPPPATTIQK